MEIYLENTERIVSSFSALLGVIAVLAMVVMVIVQVIKEIPPLHLIKTAYVVLVLSIGLTLGVLFAYASMYNLAVLWYHVGGGIVGGFFVAFISMFGWGQFKQLWRKLKVPTDLVDNLVKGGDDDGQRDEHTSLSRDSEGDE